MTVAVNNIAGILLELPVLLIRLRAGGSSHSWLVVPPVIPEWRQQCRHMQSINRTTINAGVEVQMPHKRPRSRRDENNPNLYCTEGHNHGEGEKTGIQRASDVH